MRISKGVLNITLSTSSLVLFLVVIGVGYVYVTETDRTQDQMNVTQHQMNSSVNEILDRQAIRWHTDNVRFNATLAALGDTYKELKEMEQQAAYDRKHNTEGLSKLGVKIINLTNLQIDLTNLQNNNTARNLNLTKYNRAALTSTNEIVREIAKSLNITVKPFDGNNFH